jgi:hypothetical protein
MSRGHRAVLETRSQVFVRVPRDGAARSLLEGYRDQTAPDISKFVERVDFADLRRYREASLGQLFRSIRFKLSKTVERPHLFLDGFDDCLPRFPDLESLKFFLSCHRIECCYGSERTNSIASNLIGSSAAKTTSMGNQGLDAIADRVFQRLSAVSQFKICTYELGGGTLTPEGHRRVREALLNESDRLRNLPTAIGLGAQAEVR